MVRTHPGWVGEAYWELWTVGKERKAGIDRTRAFVHSGAAPRRGGGLPVTQITVPRPSTLGPTLVCSGFADSL